MTAAVVVMICRKLSVLSPRNAADIDEHFYDIPPNNIELTPTKPATKAPARVAKYQYQPPLGARNTQARNTQAATVAGAGPYKRIFVESDKGEYFGLNTTIFKTDGLLGGMYKKLVNYYDDTAKVTSSLLSTSTSTNRKQYFYIWLSLSGLSVRSLL